MKLSPARYLSNSFLAALLLLLPIFEASGQLRINEIVALNSSLAFDTDFGEFSDYIELHNASSVPVNLSGFSISDKPGNPSKWYFPDITLQPSQYLMIWADGRNKVPGDTAFCLYRNTTINVSEIHTNFSLSGDGEYVGIFDGEKKLIDEVYFGVQQHDVSYGRNPSTPNQWSYFADPTPGETNSPYNASPPVFSGNPVFSIDGGFFTTTQQITLSSSNTNAVIRYTLDGTDPTFSSPVAGEPITIFRNYTLKARVYETGKLPGKVIFQTYFIGESIDMPVVSIITNSDHLYDFDFGLFRNSIKEREVPASIQYFDEHGKPQFAEHAGIRIFGSTIYNLPQKPVSVRFKGKFGAANINYPLFNDRDNQSFKSFNLRNGGNDHNLAYFRDGLTVNLIKNEMNIDYAAYKPCVVFINGDYHGIYEIRERIDADFLADNNNMSNANISIVEDSVNVVAGDGKEFKAMMNFLENNSLADSANYSHITSLIDIDEFTNYMIHKIFIGYPLFDLNNKYWKNNDANGKWRWIANDLEHAFGQLSGDGYQENTFAKALGDSVDMPKWATLFFSSLMINHEFSSQFAQRFATCLNTLYLPDTTIAKADALKATFMQQMPRHIRKWNTPVNMNVWQGNVDFIKEFLSQRPYYIRKHLSNYFGVKDSAKIEFSVSDGGAIYVENIPIKNKTFTGYYFEQLPLKIEAVPEPGYYFAGWQGIGSQERLVTVIPQGNLTLRALFLPGTISIVPQLIASDTILKKALSPWYVTSDVTVLPGAKLVVEPGVEILISDNASVYVNGGLFLNGIEGREISIKSNPEKWARNPLHNPQPRWGVICATNATDSVKIVHSQITGAGYGKDRLKHFSAITSLNSHCYILKTTISDNIQPFYSDSGTVYIGYSSFWSANTCDFINVKRSANALVEHCDFSGKNAFDTDAIDYDEVENGIIRNNRIYGFLGDNSDGIDLGEGCKNVLIEGNTIFNCTDKGISVGQASTCTVRNNIIYNCNMGIAVKDAGSEVFADRNTIYSNDYGIACYEKNSGVGGGIANVRNTILSASALSTLFVDNLSAITVSYSLSDKELIPGVGNIFDNPLFVNPEFSNFGLQSNSPCIDRGDPASEPDADLTRADMGAYYIPPYPKVSHHIFINEINYQSAGNYDSGDWIEIANTGNIDVDLSGWMVIIQPNRYQFGKGTIIRANDFLVICADSEKFKAQFPNAKNHTAEFAFQLPDFAGRIDLFNPGNQPVHMVKYASEFPWSGLPAGKGATLEFDSIAGDEPTHFWRESYILGGTPGKANSLPKSFDHLHINEIMASNVNTIADEFGDFDDWFELHNSSDWAINIGGLYITDKHDNPGKWQVPLNRPDLTTIPAKSFILLWADGQPEQGVMHTNFSLSASGELVELFKRQGKQFQSVQSVDFGPQTSNTSFGSYPDGSNIFKTLTPTPFKSNLLTPILSLPVNEIKVFPNPFTDFTVFRNELNDDEFHLEVYDISGRILSKDKSNNGEIIFSRGSLPVGIYFYHLIFTSGKKTSGKLLIK